MVDKSDFAKNLTILNLDYGGLCMITIQFAWRVSVDIIGVLYKVLFYIRFSTMCFGKGFFHSLKAYVLMLESGELFPNSVKIWKSYVNSMKYLKHSFKCNC